MTQTLAQSPLLTRQEAATFLRISERKLDLLTVHDGLRKIPVGRRVMFDIADLRAFINRGGTGCPASMSSAAPAALVAA